MSRPAGAAKSGGGRRWYWLLILPFAGLLWPPIYTRDDPALVGVPFFYWYQFAWILASVAVTWLVVRATDPPSDDPDER